jgi:hypothetical protein
MTRFVIKCVRLDEYSERKRQTGRCRVRWEGYTGCSIYYAENTLVKSGRPRLVQLFGSVI